MVDIQHYILISLSCLRHFLLPFYLWEKGPSMFSHPDCESKSLGQEIKLVQSTVMREDTPEARLLHSLPSHDVSDKNKNLGVLDGNNPSYGLLGHVFPLCWPQQSFCHLWRRCCLRMLAVSNVTHASLYPAAPRIPLLLHKCVAIYVWRIYGTIFF